MVRDLFQFFLDNPGQLPGNYREQAEQQPLHRVVCDYIAGMTDGFFMRVYNNSGQAAISQFPGALDR
jgi:dGTPase